MVQTQIILFIGWFISSIVSKKETLKHDRTILVSET